MPLTWTDKLATGLRQIDLQHQELIELINDLESAQVAGHWLEAKEEILPRLRAYVLFHFGTEETLFYRADKIHAEDHRRQHQEFTEYVADLHTADATANDLPDLVAYLNRWLIDHIMKTDHELARQISSQQSEF